LSDGINQQSFLINYLQHLYISCIFSPTYSFNLQSTIQRHTLSHSKSKPPNFVPFSITRDHTSLITVFHDLFRHKRLYFLNNIFHDLFHHMWLYFLNKNILWFVLKYFNPNLILHLCFFCSTFLIQLDLIKIIFLIYVNIVLPREGQIRGPKLVPICWPKMKSCLVSLKHVECLRE